MKLCHFQYKIKLTIKLSGFFFRGKKNHLLAQKPLPHTIMIPQKNHFGFPIKIINHKNQKYVEKGKGQFETENWVQIGRNRPFIVLFEK